jgi:hypothetical protein
MEPQNSNKAEISIDVSCTELADANGQLQVPFYGIRSTWDSNTPSTFAGHAIK